MDLLTFADADIEGESYFLESLGLPAQKGADSTSGEEFLRIPDTEDGTSVDPPEVGSSVDPVPEAPTLDSVPSYDHDLNSFVNELFGENQVGSTIDLGSLNEMLGYGQPEFVALNDNELGNFLEANLPDCLVSPVVPNFEIVSSTSLGSSEEAPKSEDLVSAVEPSLSTAAATDGGFPQGPVSPVEPSTSTATAMDGGFPQGQVSAVEPSTSTATAAENHKQPRGMKRTSGDSCENGAPKRRGLLVGNSRKECPHCFKYIAHTYFETHVLVLHTNPVSFLCPKCHKSFTRKHTMQKHKAKFNH